MLHFNSNGKDLFSAETKLFQKLWLNFKFFMFSILKFFYYYENSKIKIFSVKKGLHSKMLRKKKRKKKSKKKNMNNEIRTKDQKLRRISVRISLSVLWTGECTKIPHEQICLRTSWCKLWMPLNEINTWGLMIFYRFKALVCS